MRGYNIMRYHEELMDKLLTLRPDLDKKVVVKEIQKIAENTIWYSFVVITKTNYIRLMRLL